MSNHIQYWYVQLKCNIVVIISFNNCRWVEDVDVAVRAVEIWPHVTKYVKEVLKKKKSEIPTSTSFGIVRDAVLSDSLVIAKLEFFTFVARMVKPFLTKYQVICPINL